MTETFRARTLLACAMGVEAGEGCRCAVCGRSPYDPAGTVRRTLGSNFTDFGLLADTGAEHVCEGCQRLMAGRPGDDPPPLRTVSVRVTTDGQMHVLGRDDWWDLLTLDEAIEAGEVLSWATSRKRHHWLRAGISTPDRWVVGSDAGPIEWEPDPAPAAAVLAMRQIGATKGAILSGHYPVRLRSEHLSAIEAAEAVLATLRGHPILDLVVWAAPKVEREEQRPVQEDADVIDPNDARAAELIGRLAWGSEMRAEDGIVFWGGYLLRRLRRFARLPLATCVSRLVGECHIGVSAAAQAAAMVEAMDEDEMAATETALRARTDLIHALAFARMETYRSARKETT